MMNGVHRLDTPARPNSEVAMSARLVRIGGTAVVLLVCGTILAAHAAKPRKAKEAPPASGGAETQASTWPAAELTVGFQVRDSETEGIGDLLIPIWNPGGNGLLFINPRSAITDHSAEEYNLGIGYRQLLPKLDVILGVNAYYDYRDTRFDHYSQWGAGFEILTAWIDARANYYDPESKQVVVARETETTTRQTVQSSSSFSDPVAEGHEVVQDFVMTRTVITETFTRTFEQYQQPLGGHDWEIGLRLPIRSKRVEARIFGGYYDFDRDFGDDVKGWKARAELRLNSTLFLDAGIYENDELTGSDWFAGARLAVPLDLAAVSRGRNPFARAPARWRGEGREFSARLTEMVMRDPQIRLETSKMIENKALATEDVARGKIVQRVSLTLLPDAMFVDGDAPFSGDGSAEFPFTSIQTGANNVFGAQNVYVFNASGPYNENVVLQPGTTLWGSGSPIEGFGGKFFGSGIAPIVDGMSMGPSITMANQTTVRGFHVRNTDMGGGPILSSVPGTSIVDISRVGIFGNNATGLHVMHNVIANNVHGAVFQRAGDFDLSFTENSVLNNQGRGLWIEGVGASGSFQAVLERSWFNNNQGGGGLVMARDYDVSQVEIWNSTFHGNAGTGLELVQFFSGIALVEVQDSAFAGNAGSGLAVTQFDNSIQLVGAIGVSSRHNGAFGLNVVQNMADASVFVLRDVRASDNGATGVGLVQIDSDMQLALLSNVSSHRNVDNGLTIVQIDGLLGGAALENVRANDNLGGGIAVTQIDHQQHVAFVDGATTHRNGGTGLSIVQIDGLLGEVELENVRANDNLGQGIAVVQISHQQHTAFVDGAISHRNDGHGLSIVQIQSDNAQASVQNAASDSNTGSGIYIVQVSNDDSSSAVADSSAHDNTEYGIASIQTGFTSAIASFMNVDATGNGLDDTLMIQVP
jgi:hypothetical protein